MLYVLESYVAGEVLQPKQGQRQWGGPLSQLGDWNTGGFWLHAGCQDKMVTPDRLPAVCPLTQGSLAWIQI